MQLGYFGKSHQIPKQPIFISYFAISFEKLPKTHFSTPGFDIHHPLSSTLERFVSFFDLIPSTHKCLQISRQTVMGLDLILVEAFHCILQRPGDLQSTNSGPYA